MTVRKLLETMGSELTLDTVDTVEYIDGVLADEGKPAGLLYQGSAKVLKKELDVPLHLVPPNPDDSDILPSQVHPSYPYGNPTHTKHPSAKPRPPYDPASRALFEDMGYNGAGVNGSLRWRDLGLNDLLPVDEEKEEEKKALQARKMASGASSHNPQAQQQQQPAPQAQQDQAEDDDDDDDDDEDDDEDEDDENDENENGDLDEDDEDDEEEEDSEEDRQVE